MMAVSSLKETSVKKVLLSLFVLLIGASFIAPEAQARRLGGGATSGMKRQTPPPQPAQAVPAKPADATPQTPAGTASWPVDRCSGPRTLAAPAACWPYALTPPWLAISAAFSKARMRTIVR
jgi:hypothetical protein